MTKPELFLFLDIDGVFMTSRTYSQKNDEGKIHTILDSDAVVNFNNFLSKVTPKYRIRVVISSTWRKYNSIDKIKQLFRTNKVNFDYSDPWGITPNFSARTVNGILQDRGYEIGTYLAERFTEGFGPDFLIFDDDSDMAGLKPAFLDHILPIQTVSEKFVHVRGRNGFSEEDTVKSLKLLHL